MNNKFLSSRYLAKGGIIAALYVVFTYISYTMNLSGQLAVQMRLSEALTILPIFTPAARPAPQCFVNLPFRKLWT